MGEKTEDQRHLVFTAFDPVKGRGREVTRIATHSGLEYNWDLSPDGSQSATQFPAGENHIRLLPLGGGAPRDLVVKGWYGFGRVHWALDGKGLYVAGSSPRGATLLYIDLKGQASPVWEQKGGVETGGVPSPDGRHLAILGFTVDSNVWVLENFKLGSSPAVNRRRARSDQNPFVREGAAPNVLCADPRCQDPKNRPSLMTPRAGLHLRLPDRIGQQAQIDNRRMEKAIGRN